MLNFLFYEDVAVPTKENESKHFSYCFVMLIVTILNGMRSILVHCSHIDEIAGTSSVTNFIKSCYEGYFA